MAYKYDLRNEGKRAEMLRREEEAYLAKWLACGADRSSFAELRKLHLEEFALQQKTGRSKAEMAEKGEALKIRLSRLWDDIRGELYRHTVRSYLRDDRVLR